MEAPTHSVSLRTLGVLQGIRGCAGSRSPGRLTAAHHTVSRLRNNVIVANCHKVDNHSRSDLAAELMALAG